MQGTFERADALTPMSSSPHRSSCSCGHRGRAAASVAGTKLELHSVRGRGGRAHHDLLRAVVDEEEATEVDEDDLNQCEQLHAAAQLALVRLVASLTVASWAAS